jgi:UTP--glucose-1-phosphate uridylyltransferase
MQIKKAVITAAARDQRTLPMQTLIDQHGNARSVLSLIVNEAVRARIDEICVVVCPGDEPEYAKLVGDVGARLRFVPQLDPRGYGQAVYCAREFTGDDPFLHLVGDHIYVSEGVMGCAAPLVELASAQSCAVSAVQVTRENLLPYFGAIGGQPVGGRQGVYRVETVIEKPTPTEAEQTLVVPGLRSGQYLCFYGMHVLTPSVMDILEARLASTPQSSVSLSSALAELAHREQYLAMVQSGTRYDVGIKYGLFYSQLAIALAGKDRDQVLGRLLETVLNREVTRDAKGVQA